MSVGPTTRMQRGRPSHPSVTVSGEFASTFPSPHSDNELSNILSILYSRDRGIATATSCSHFTELPG